MAQQQVLILGGGVVGACVAYELSALPHLNLTLLEAGPSPAQGSTGAALGICMGVISHKTKGRNWRLREASLRRYERLIPELQARLSLDDRSIPFNTQGLVKLILRGEDWSGWQRLQAKRSSQGYPLQCWTREQVAQRVPGLNLEAIDGAVYSPQDRQVDPLWLTEALITAAQDRGVQVLFNSPVQDLLPSPSTQTPERPSRCEGVTVQRPAAGYGSHHDRSDQSTTLDTLEPDWIIVTAGLGTNQFLQEPPPQPTQVQQPLLQAVLGQGWQVSLPTPLWHNPQDLPLHPVITGDDLHLVPLLNSKRPWPTNSPPIYPQALATPSHNPSEVRYHYSLGATLEFPPDHTLTPQATQTAADELWQRILHYYPALMDAHIEAHWSGLRPRPLERSAPLVQWSGQYTNVLLATGHYRNGVFLAPGTALWVKDQILSRIPGG